MGILSKLFGIGPKVDLGQLINEGAIILDVRTTGEYAGGHVKGSINIPVDQLKNKMSGLKKDKTIITCCASGMRSGAARGMLKANGFVEVHNGGSWASLKKYER
ncbi:MAG: rhodanese-like domain-containing protein [Bacteroidetes bacterium]|nr:rhodanese-like domain-containing protein [Bacteroidota bacterium]